MTTWQDQDAARAHAHAERPHSITGRRRAAPVCVRPGAEGVTGGNFHASSKNPCALTDSGSCRLPVSVMFTIAQSGSFGDCRSLFDWSWNVKPLLMTTYFFGFSGLGKIMTGAWTSAEKCSPPTSMPAAVHLTGSLAAIFL